MTSEHKTQLKKQRVSPVAEIAVRGSEVDGYVCVAAMGPHFVTVALFGRVRPMFFGKRHETIEAAKAAALVGRQTVGEWVDC